MHCEDERIRPADFYTGIVADLYEPLKSARPNPAEYARFIEELGEPALELGCGDGHPLLDLRRRGIDVEGVDSSANMLDRCRRKAAEAGLKVAVHHQRMEELDLPRRYRSIFLAGPTFTLLPDDDTALRALQCIRAHLDAGGAALVPLFIPSPTPAEHFGRLREARAGDGAVLRVSIVAEDRNVSARTQVTTLRYERHAAGADTVVDRPWTLHWHTPEGFQRLTAAAGLAATITDGDSGQAASADSSEFTFLLRPTRD